MSLKPIVVMCGAFLNLVIGCSAGERAVGREPPVDSVPDILTDLTLEHTKNDGNGQSGVVRTLFPEPLKVRVMKKGVPIPGIFVSWSSEQLDAEFTPELSKSDAFGYARTSLRAGTRSGTTVVTASVPGVITYFYEGVAPADAAVMEYVSGSGVFTQRSVPLTVLVKDRYGNPVWNHPVTWTVVNGNFTVSSDTTMSSFAGYSSVVVLFGDSTGSVTVEADNVGSAPVVFDVTRN